MGRQLSMSLECCVDRRSDAEQDYESEHDYIFDTRSLASYLWPIYAERVDLELTSNPSLELTDRGLGLSRAASLLSYGHECEYCERHSGERDHDSDAIVLPIESTGTGSDQDGASDDEVVDHLEAAIDPLLVPGHHVIQGGDEKRRVAFGRALTGLFGHHPGMVA